MGNYLLDYSTIRLNVYYQNYIFKKLMKNWISKKGYYCSKTTPSTPPTYPPTSPLSLADKNKSL